MKNILFVPIILMTLTLNAQVILDPASENNLAAISGFCNATVQISNGLVHGVVEDNYPFKLYEVNSTHLHSQQDLHTAIRRSVPGVSITDTQLGQIPVITMRGDRNTVIIVDGVSYDTSILNTLNPQDIERISVATNSISNNYLAHTSN
ncbi:TonB-dependent receptor plug domain-containing protein [Cellulophaga sp. HaHa_2_95]|uniref:TonB-dependent receptor plug domain-containing protein n=1 Tax=Cellulophaga sp. HaHa_2_95 TaxID=2745558 RepID=UPI001C4F570B|nr:TonB-dependent receptor plug domain-containing protein [Cellulophaga sp. HaHa_2_95]QXP55012.1 TonB-dependent receptor plug domain-containing protein [Cellulophaga sp. HaHa_2_95]